MKNYYLLINFPPEQIQEEDVAVLRLSFLGGTGNYIMEIRTQINQTSW